MNIVIKSKETREGVRFRVLNDNGYVFKSLPFNNYFYVRINDYERYAEEFRSRYGRLVSNIEKGKNFVRISMNNNYMRMQLRDWWEQYCKTYEADIKANKRFLLDKKITLNNEHIPYCFFDIETEDVLPLKKDERGNIDSNGQRILSCAFCDDKNNVSYYELKEMSDEAETELLNEILKTFSKYGIVSGWNSLRFDMPYIKQRCDVLGIKYEILDYVNHIDYKEIFQKYEKKTLRSYSLNSVSNYILGRSKVDQKKGNGAIYNTWMNDKEHLRKYNIEDVQLLYDINKVRLFMEVTMHRANNAGCHVQNTMHNSDSGDYYLMRKYKERGIIMPSKPNRAEIQERMKYGKIGGGFTNCFEAGFFERVDVWDFASMYPSVVQTWNISPETYVESVNKCTATDYPDYIITPANFDTQYHPHRLYRKKEGVFPAAARELVAERAKIKYQLTPELKKENPDLHRRMYLEQYALKVDANSYFYGLLSFAPGRYFNWHVADSVTSACQGMIKPCYQKLREWGCKVIGGDTDSTFAVLPPELTPEMIDKKFKDYFDEWVKLWNVEMHCLLFEYEKTFTPMLFVAKKNYAYRMNNENHIVGMEAIKADSAIVAAEMQKEIVYEMLEGKFDCQDWQQKIEDLYNKVYNQELTTAELSLVKGLSKMPKEYEGYVISKATGKPKVKANGELQKKAIPAHVKLAERLMAKGIDLYPGSKIKFIVIKDKPILAISPEEYDAGPGTFPYTSKKKGDIDYYWDGGYEASYYWTRIIKPAIKVIFAYYQSLEGWKFYLTDSQMKKILKDKLGDDDD